MRRPHSIAVPKLGRPADHLLIGCQVSCRFVDRNPPGGHCLPSYRPSDLSKVTTHPVTNALRYVIVLFALGLVSGLYRVFKKKRKKRLALFL